MSACTQTSDLPTSYTTEFVTSDGLRATWAERPESHLVMRAAAPADGRLLVFLTGTNGSPERDPRGFLRAALAAGYHVIDLAYDTVPAVAQVCIPEREEADCAERFRGLRAFGDAGPAPIPDAAEDSIATRLERLLRSLATLDPNGGWQAYLDAAGTVRWKEIVLSGFSEGGGMAAFMAKRIEVARVIDFSGGWDIGGAAHTVAAWYSRKSATPPTAWYGVYHVAEPRSAVIAETYRALRIPAAHVFRLNGPTSRRNAHAAGVADSRYQRVWREILGDAGR